MRKKMTQPKRHADFCKEHAHNIAKILAALYSRDIFPPSSSIEKALDHYWEEYNRIVKAYDERKI